MSEELKHYRYGGNITHIGMEALPSGKDIVVEIERIVYNEKEKVNGEVKSAWVCYFKKNPYFDLPMILNSTNKKRIARLAETPYLETVKDLRVTLTKEWDKAFGGGKDWGLRVSKIPPKKVTNTGETEKIQLTPKSSNWNDIVGWVKGGGAMESVTKKYAISESDLVLFNEALKEEQNEA